jgi:alpha-L-arabinofuranosidase
VLTGPSAKACNSFEQPDVVESAPFTDVRIADGRATTELPPLSVAALTFQSE